MSLVSGHPAMIRFFNFWRWLSCVDACCITATDMHSRMSVALCIASTQMSKSFIGLSLPSMWLYLDSQSAINISGPGLYMIWTLYWWTFYNIYWIHCDNVATSFLNIAMSGLWSVMTSTSLPKQSWWNFSNPCSIPSTSHSILLYLCSGPVKLLLANVISLGLALSGTMSLWHAVLSCSCGSTAPRPTPDTSVSK